MSYQVGKLYKSREGWKVRIYATDGTLSRPIHGAACDPSNGLWVSLVWRSNGTRDEGATSCHDIVGDWADPVPVPPPYRPYSDEQLNACIGKRIIQRDNGRSCLIGFEVGYGLVFVFGANLNVSADNLLEYYTWPDGTPCGVLEKGGE